MTICEQGGMTYFFPDPEDASCDSCEAAMINGHYCHETGCPNIHNVKVNGSWRPIVDEDESVPVEGEGY
jgi:hypothetical protein